VRPFASHPAGRAVLYRTQGHHHHGQQDRFPRFRRLCRCRHHHLGGTNATPVVITLAAGHYLKEGDRLAIAGVTGNTNMNGEWTLANVTATTATLLGCAGNGTFGGTVRVAKKFDTTPNMRNHSAAMHTFGNLVGTVDIESYESYSDFASGFNTAGAVAPVVTPSAGTNSVGSSFHAGQDDHHRGRDQCRLCVEVKMASYMRMNVTAYTSGSIGAAVEA
jgi:hypothetical protein